METLDQLSDTGAINALSTVVARWSAERGLEALVIVLQARQQSTSSYEKVPVWASGPPISTQEAGRFAKKMLRTLESGDDDEIAAWTRTAIESQFKIKAHVLDPISLSIVGAILIGGILAARVKKIGNVEFYEGIPKELGDVMKAGASIAVPPGAQ